MLFENRADFGIMECYQGKSAESVKTYLKEVHMTLLTSIQQAIQLYRTKYLFYREGYYDMEGDLYAVIPQKTLLSVKDRMKTEIEDVSDSSLISTNKFVKCIGSYCFAGA